MKGGSLQLQRTHSYWENSVAMQLNIKLNEWHDLGTT
jgi:hypothetical protein